MTKATNYRLEIANKESPKREEIVKRQKTEAIATKRQRIRKRISLSNKEEESYKSNIGDEMDPDQANDEYSLQL